MHYHVKDELWDCIQSIQKSKTKSSYEIIVVDNDEIKTIEKDLNKKFPKVRYISNENKGFGQANNVGASKAKGEYVFFLNPDTKIAPDALEHLLQFLKKRKNVGIVAPLLHDMKNKPYQQGAQTLTPLRGIFALSFINKIFPNNTISRNYYFADWDRKSKKEVDVLPGTALFMKKELFKEVGGFDEHFFLYFEEFDLCKRIKAMGYQLFITPSAKVKHHWGASTKKRSDIQRIFDNSRFYYFKKHFGFPAALITTFFIQLNKFSLAVALLLAVSAFLNTYKLQELMNFLGDYAWFYLSARDMLLTGTIPLVGIESSRVWLHQGALWTYMIAPWLWIFQFHPVSVAYLSGLIGVITVYALYKVGSALFSRRIGFIAALFCAVSPFAVMNARAPYHTNPIPLTVIAFIFTLYKWISGRIVYFPISIFLLGILYNLELATFVFVGALLFILLYGLVRKRTWAMDIFTPRIMILSVIAFALSMLPMLIYDMFHGYPQTIGFLKWFGYKILVTIGIIDGAETGTNTIVQMLQFMGESYKNTFLAFSGLSALTLFTVSLGLFVYKMKKTQALNSQRKNIYLIGIINIVGIAGLFASGTPSGAYLPMLLPGIFLITAFAFDILFEKKRTGVLAGMILGSIVFANIYYMLTYNFYHAGLVDHLSYGKIKDISHQIVEQANGQPYSLHGKGPGSQFESFTMNYEYVTWWMGHGPSSQKEHLQFVLDAKIDGITVTQRKQ